MRDKIGRLIYGASVLVISFTVTYVVVSWLTSSIASGIVYR